MLLLWLWLLRLLPPGAAVCASGQLVASPGAKQAVELKADRLVLVGGCDAESYPLQKVRGCGVACWGRCEAQSVWLEALHNGVDGIGAVASTTSRARSWTD